MKKSPQPFGQGDNPGASTGGDNYRSGRRRDVLSARLSHMA